jgi:hypothetical protein
MVKPRYAGPHQAMRRRMLPYAIGSRCVRCGLVILRGQDLDLDHTDDGAAYAGWSHAHCNRSAGAQMGNLQRSERRNARRERTRKLLKEVCLGLEIAEDRSHVANCAAGRLDDDLILVELAGYLAGTDPIAEVLRLRSERTVQAVALDPHSPGATLCKLLRNAGVRFTEMTTHDVAVAHGQFRDLLNEGKLKVVQDARLSAAVKHGQDRRLGGASARERRGAAVDVSPALAAEFAVWSLSSKSNYNLYESFY